MRIVTYIAAAALVLGSCKKADQHLPPNFNYDIPPVALTENVHVGAYYYNYSATDWSKKYTDTPTLGQYSALDAEVMAQHRAWADQGGVDFFIFNWNGAAAGDPLLNSFVNGRNHSVKMVINYNTSHLKVSNTSPLAGAKLTTLIDEFKGFADNHFQKDYYFRVDGKPVVMITPLNLSSSAAASIDYTTVIPALRTAMAEAGIELYIMGEITSGWLPPQRYATAVKMMDGVNLSNWSTDVYDRATFFPSFSDMNWKNWSDSTTKWGMDYVPVIFPGFDDKVMTPTSKLYNIDRSEKFYTDYCNVAKRNMGEERIVLVNSWNDFQKGTSLEPTIEYGTRYLELTRSQFKIK